MLLKPFLESFPYRISDLVELNWIYENCTSTEELDDCLNDRKLARLDVWDFRAIYNQQDDSYEFSFDVSN